MTAFGGLPLALALLALTLLVLYMAVHWALAFGVAARLRTRLGWPLWVGAAAGLGRGRAPAQLPLLRLPLGRPRATRRSRTLPVAQLASLARRLRDRRPGGAGQRRAGRGARRPCASGGARRCARWRWRPRLLALTLGSTAPRTSPRCGPRWRPRRAAPVGVVQPNVDQSRKNGAGVVRPVHPRPAGARRPSRPTGPASTWWPGPRRPSPTTSRPTFRASTCRGPGCRASPTPTCWPGAPTLEWPRDAAGAPRAAGGQHALPARPRAPGAGALPEDAPGALRRVRPGGWSGPCCRS